MSVLHRYRWLVLAVLGVGLIVGAFLSERGRRVPLTPTTGGQQVRTEGSLGPTPGPDAEGYIAEKKSHLEDASRSAPTARSAALVSLARLHAPDELAALAGESRLDFLFVRYPHGATEVLAVEGTIEVTIGGAVTRQAAALEAEVAQLEAVARTSSEADRERHLQDAAAKRGVATSIRSRCECVYALVLGPTQLSALAGLQQRPDVRLVDVPDPPVDDLRGWELTPILPKEPA